MKPNTFTRLLIVNALFGLLFLQADNHLTSSFFENKPRSLAKDFYISKFLDQNISVQEAESLISDVANMNFRLFYKFADKIDDFGFAYTKQCLQLEAEKFQGKAADCIAMGLSFYKATNLPPKALLEIADAIHYAYPNIADAYKIIAARSFETLLNSDPSLALEVFNNVGSTFRETYFNKPLPEKNVIAFAKQHGFNTSIEKIVRNPKLDQLQKSLLKFDSSTLNSESNFLLGLNALKLGHNEIAIWYLKQSAQMAYQQYDKDKAHFWQYLCTKDKTYLEELTQSKEINFYALLAYEKLGKNIQGIYTSIEPKQSKSTFDIEDPFAWLAIKERFKETLFQDFNAKRKEAMTLNSEQTQGHVAKLIYQFGNGEHYFLTPYLKDINTTSAKRAALIFAIQRQESRFIPTAVSYSYALGLMQFMPYVAKEIANKNGIENYQDEMLFNPRMAYRFANIHLDYLEKWLYHPLLIAYAYNAGIGYTKRQIIQKSYFAEGEYEPYMSMEMLPNGQAREYGKKVLANYAVYLKILGDKKASLNRLCETLKPAHRIHGF